MSQDHTLRMTEGAIAPLLVRFFVPLFLSALVQQLYTLTDAVIVGRFAGTLAFGALDVASNFLRLPLALFFGLAGGATILIAQSFGSGNYRRLNRTIHTLMLFTVLCGLALALLGTLITPWGISWMRVPQEMQSDATVYMNLLYWGTGLLFLYNVAAAVLRALGDSKRPFYYLFLTAVLNILLDLLFVAVFNWGVAGAALATIISTGVATFFAIKALCRLDSRYALRWRRLKFHGVEFRMTLKLGLPMAAQSFLYPLANMIIQREINSFGTTAIAAWAAVGKVDMVVWIVGDALSQTMSTFAGQNYGMGHIDRIKAGLRRAALMVVAVIALLSGALFVGVPYLTRLFVADAAVIALASHIMRLYMAPFYTVCCFGNLFGGLVSGTGDTFWPMVVTLSANCIVKVGFIFTIAQMHHQLGVVIFSYPLAWLTSTLGFCSLYFFYHRRKLERHGAALAPAQ